MLEKLKNRVCQHTLELLHSNLALLTFGNVSGIDRDLGLVVIKASGIPHEELKPEHMMVVDLQFNIVEGKYRPSMDTPTHIVLYRSWPEVGGITHSHSPYASAFAQAERPLPCLGATHADYFHGEVPLTRALTADEIETEYEKNTGKAIVERMNGANPMEKRGVLVRGHGSFTWGKDPVESLRNAVALEESARLAYLTMQLNPNATPPSPSLCDKHYYRKHGPKASYGQIW
jgi:L-ribulose-5-phosphate 4-epimerase